MSIKKLSDILISRIAAGEVIERPASVVKELVENSIDANADEISVKIEQAGQNLIEIKDNGTGIAKAELELALTRNATSKISGTNLLEINSLGFRGEGLASIASIAKLKLCSKPQMQEFAYEISANAGKYSEVRASNLTQGTLVTVDDLFFATPARLKFLKSEKSETNHIIEILRKIALAQPHISFSLNIDGKNYFNLGKANIKQRIADIISLEFIKNAEEINFIQDDYKFSGYTSLPTFNRASSLQQYIFVNQRPIKDKIIYNAIKTAYQDFLAKDRHAVITLFIELPNTEIDVNVHPTKAEIRFRDAQKLRSNLIIALKTAIEKSGFRASSETGNQALNYINNNSIPQENRTSFSNSYNNYTARASEQRHNIAAEFLVNEPDNASSLAQTQINLAPQNKDFSGEVQAEYLSFPLGSAVAQLHKTYIIAQTQNGLVIVDQHAAHERIIYEKLKSALKDKQIVTQKHLFSEIVELNEEALNILLVNSEELYKFGVIIEKFGAKAVIIKETPEIFKEVNIKDFIQDLADNMLEYGQALNLLDKFTEIYGNHACRNAIRAGRVLNIAEMNDILRNMEVTPFSGQCNHGRPTYVELKKHDLEKLFGRK